MSLPGLAVGKKDLLDEIAMTTLKDIGGVIAPFDAWLLLRGLKTLPVRMERHCTNAEEIVKRLKEHPNVSTVYYPNDDSHPDYPIMKKQMRRGGESFHFH